jgi:hypothetical protein
MFKSAALALIALSASAGAALAQPPADAASADLHCAIALAFLSTRATDPKMQQGMVVGIGYYIGRLKGRDPNIDLASRALAEVKTLKPADLQGDAVRCGGELQALGAETKSLGEALKAFAAANGVGGGK